MKARSKKVGVIGIVAIVLLIAIILVVDIPCGTYASPITPYFRGGNVETNYSVSRTDAYKASGDFTVKEAAEHRLFVNTAGISVDSGLSYAWVALPVVISVVPALGAVAIFVFMVFPAFFVKKKEA